MQPVLGPSDLEAKRDTKGPSSTFAQSQVQIEDELEPMLGPLAVQNDKKRSAFNAQVELEDELEQNM